MHEETFQQGITKETTNLFVELSDIDQIDKGHIVQRINEQGAQIGFIPKVLTPFLFEVCWVQISDLKKQGEKVNGFVEKYNERSLTVEGVTWEISSNDAFDFILIEGTHFGSRGKVGNTPTYELTTDGVSQLSSAAANADLFSKIVLDLTTEKVPGTKKAGKIQEDPEVKRAREEREAVEAASFIAMLGTEIICPELQNLQPGQFVRITNQSLEHFEGIPVIGLVTQNRSGAAQILEVAYPGLKEPRYFTYGILRQMTPPPTMFEVTVSDKALQGQVQKAILKGDLGLVVSLLAPKEVALPIADVTPVESVAILGQSDEIKLPNKAEFIDEQPKATTNNGEVVQEEAPIIVCDPKVEIVTDPARIESSVPIVEISPVSLQVESVVTETEVLREETNKDVQISEPSPALKKDKVPKAKKQTVNKQKNNVAWCSLSDLENWGQIVFPVPILLQWKSFLGDLEDPNSTLGSSRGSLPDGSERRSYPGVFRGLTGNGIDVDVVVPNASGSFEIRDLWISRERILDKQSLILPLSADVLPTATTHGGKIVPSELAKYVTQYKAGVVDEKNLKKHGIVLVGLEELENLGRWIPCGIIPLDQLTLPLFVRFQHGSTQQIMGLLVESQEDSLVVFDASKAEYRFNKATFNGEMLIAEAAFKDAEGTRALKELGISGPLIDLYQEFSTRVELPVPVTVSATAIPDAVVSSIGSLDLEPKSAGFPSERSRADRKLTSGGTVKRKVEKSAAATPDNGQEKRKRGETKTATERLETAKSFFKENILPRVIEVRAEPKVDQRNWSLVNMGVIRDQDGYYQACGQLGTWYKDWKGLLKAGGAVFSKELGGEITEEEIAHIEAADKARVKGTQRAAHLKYTPEVLETLKSDLKVRWRKAVAEYRAAEKGNTGVKADFSYFVTTELFKNRGLEALATNPNTGERSIEYLLKTVIGATQEECAMRAVSLDGVKYSEEDRKILTLNLKKLWAKAVETGDFSRFVGDKLRHSPGATQFGTDPQTGLYTNDYLLSHCIGATEEEMRQREKYVNLLFSKYTTAQRIEKISEYRTAWEQACATGDFSSFIGEEFLDEPLVDRLSINPSSGAKSIDYFLRDVIGATEADIARREQSKR